MNARRFQSVQNLVGLLAALVAVFVGFATKVPGFASLGTLELIARQSVVVLLVALGMTFVIIVGGIDLSVGSTAALAGVGIATLIGNGQTHHYAVSQGFAAVLGTVVGFAVLSPIRHFARRRAGEAFTPPYEIAALLVALALAWLTYLLAAGREYSVGGMSPILGALCGVLAGLACGAANGLLITRLRVVPFIVTLGTYLSIRGGAKWLGNEQKVDARETWLNDLLSTLSPSERWHVLPWGVWFTLALAFLMAFVLRAMRFGRHVVAVGSNEAAARLCGIPVERVKLGVYALSGLFAGLAGLMNFSRLTVGDPTAMVGLELDAIAAVVIGGASLSGGEGSIAGSMIGALIMSVLRAGAGQMGLQNYVQEIVTGGIIVLAVWLDRVRKSRAASAG